MTTTNSGSSSGPPFPVDPALRLVDHHTRADASPRQQPSGRDVFEILVREHADMLIAYLRSLLGADPTVDDIFQQSMLVAWRRLSEYDRARPFGPWLRGISRTLVLEHHRRGRARATCTDPAVLAELDVRYDQVSAMPGDSFRERADRLNACMARLPEAMRNAIEMVYARGMMIAIAADALGASEEAVKKRVQRARILLAECLRSGGVHT